MGDAGSFSLCLTFVVFILNISSRVGFVVVFFFFSLWGMKPLEMFLSQQPVVNCSAQKHFTFPEHSATMSRLLSWCGEAV